MSYPHAGMQLQKGIRIIIVYDPCTEAIGNIILVSTKHEYHSVDPAYLVLHDYFLEVDEDEIPKYSKAGISILLECVAEQERYYEQQRKEEQNSKQKLIEEKISEQQIIEDQTSEKIVVDKFVYDTSQGRMDSIRFGGAVLSNDKAVIARRVDIISECQNKTEESQKPEAEEDFTKNAQLAQVPSENTLPLSMVDTTSIMPSFNTSSLESGGTSIISLPVFTALYLGTMTSSPTPSLDSTPSLINPTPPTGGTSAGASSADNPNIYSLPVCMPLLPPRTGIGVQDSSPPPTASICSTGVYAIAFSASPTNVADNPDNPDLGFDRSGIVPDNTRKPALDLWAYDALRG